jgi:hypothetical protein
MEGIAAALKRASRGADPEDVARSLARSQPNALRFSRFSSFDDFEAAGRELGARAAKARTPEELAAINAEANALQNAYNKFTNNMSMPKGAPAFGGEPVSATERAVLESKYPGRYLDPQTGYPQSMAGKPVMRDPRSAEESVAAALNTVGGNQARSPSGISYLFDKSRALSPEGHPMSVRGPGGQMQKLEGFTPGQRLAQAGSAGVVGGALTAGAMRDEPINRYTGDAVDAEALLKAYGPKASESVPAPATVSPAFSQFGFNAFRQNTAPTYTGDAVDAEALTQKYGTRAPAPAAAPSRAAPIPERAQRPEPSILSRALSKVYDPRYLEDKSSRELYTEAQRMGGTGDEYGANLMNIRAADRARREMPEERASGGATNGKPGKDAALHKALEIIHMMLSRR